MENKVAEDSCNYNSIGDIIRRYRDVTKMTQSELCFDLNNYLKEIGVDKYTVSQTSMTKYEAGNAIPDINVVRYLNDRILKTGIDVKSKVLYIVDELISITDVPIDDIEQLLRVKKKQQLIDFLRGHIAQSDNRLSVNVKNETFRLIVDELYDFPEDVHMDLNYNIIKSPIFYSLNATSLLLYYLTYQYISIQIDNNLLYSRIRDLCAEKNIKIAARSRVSKLDMVNLLEVVVYQVSLIKLMWKSPMLSLLRLFLSILATEGIMFKENDTNEKKVAIVSKLMDSIRILTYIGYLAESQKRYNRILPFTWKYSRTDHVDTFFNNIRLTVNDPLIMVGYLFMLYPYKPLLNTEDELYQQLQSLLEQEGNISKFINKEAIQLLAKSILENKDANTTKKKISLFRLINSLQAVNDWDVKLST